MAERKMCPTREQGMISRVPPHIQTRRDSSGVGGGGESVSE